MKRILCAIVLILLMGCGNDDDYDPTPYDDEPSNEVRTVDAPSPGNCVLFRDNIECNFGRS